MAQMNNRWVDARTRFWNQVIKTDSCWLWAGHKLWNGYGAIKVNGERFKAHAYSWLIHDRHIDSRILCHTCDNPACVNPDHLYLGTHKQNARDRDSRGRNGFSKKTHCKRGHELSGENVYLHGGKRHCKACKKKPLPEPPKQ